VIERELPFRWLPEMKSHLTSQRELHVMIKKNELKLPWVPRAKSIMIVHPEQTMTMCLTD
jgi:hypothetical protein